MTHLPHLPATTALPEPINGRAVRAAEPAPPTARGDGRLRRDPLRSDAGGSPGRADEVAARRTRRDPDTREAARRRLANATNRFYVQYLAQQQAPQRRPAIPHHSGIAAYATLTFDDEILLPGATAPLAGTGGPRLDILI